MSDYFVIRKPVSEDTDDELASTETYVRFRRSLMDGYLGLFDGPYGANRWAPTSDGLIYASAVGIGMSRWGRHALGDPAAEHLSLWGHIEAERGIDIDPWLAYPDRFHATWTTDLAAQVRRASSTVILAVPKADPAFSTVVARQWEATVAHLAALGAQLEASLVGTGLTSELLIAALTHVAAASESEGDAAGFTDAELVALAEAGIELSGPTPTEQIRAAVAAAELATLAAQKLTVKEAAERLGVTPARIRQRVGAGDLFAITTGETIELPEWQFEGAQALPGLVAVVGAAEGLHPLTLARFMTRPSDELLIEDQPVSPRLWLMGGGDPERVAEVVAGLGVA